MVEVDNNGHFTRASAHRSDWVVNPRTDIPCHMLRHCGIPDFGLTRAIRNIVKCGIVGKAA